MNRFRIAAPGGADAHGSSRPGGGGFDADGIGYTDNLAVVAYCRAAGYGVLDQDAAPGAALEEDEQDEAARRSLVDVSDPDDVRTKLALPRGRQYQPGELVAGPRPPAGVVLTYVIHGPRDLNGEAYNGVVFTNGIAFTNDPATVAAYSLRSGFWISDRTLVSADKPVQAFDLPADPAVRLNRATEGPGEATGDTRAFEVRAPASRDALEDPRPEEDYVYPIDGISREIR